MNCFICTNKHACIYVRMFVHTYIKSHVAVCLRRGEDSNLYVVVSGTHFPSDWMFASAAIHAYIMKFRLVQYDKFYGGEKQEDASECLTMLIELINKDSVPYYGSNHNYSTGVSLSEILFSFMLEKYIACDACGLRPPSVEPSCVLYITPTVTSMQELIKQGMEQNEKSHAFDARRTLGMSNLIISYSFQNIWLLLLIDLDIVTILPKIDVPYPWIWLLYLVSMHSARAPIQYKDFVLLV